MILGDIQYSTFQSTRRQKKKKRITQMEILESVLLYSVEKKNTIIVKGIKNLRDRMTYIGLTIKPYYFT